MTESHWYTYTAELYLFTSGNNTAWETVTGKTLATSDRGAAIAAEQEPRANKSTAETWLSSRRKSR